MNLALSALLILLLLLPAFSFRLGIAIFSGATKKTASNTAALQDQITIRNVSKALAKLNFTEIIFLFSLVPIVLHLLSILLIKATGNIIKFDLLLNIFAGKDDVITTKGNSDFQVDLNCFLLYTLIETVVGCLFGILMASLFLGKKWMVKALMGNNIWYRLFSGFTLTETNRAKIHSILVEAVTLTKESTVIYSGLLKAYEVVPDSDQLSYITLQSASRRDLRASQIVNKNPASATESITTFDKDYGALINIPGHHLTLLGKDILNVNVTYMELVRDSSSAANAQKLVPITT